MYQGGMWGKLRNIPRVFQYCKTEYFVEKSNNLFTKNVYQKTNKQNRKENRVANASVVHSK